MHYLICDVNIKEEGHYIGWNQYILDNIHKLEESRSDLKFSFLYNNKANELLQFPDHIKGRVHFLDVNGDHLKATNRIKVFNKVAAFAKECNINHLVFLDLDKYQLAIFLCKGNFKISGILFRPHHRIMPSRLDFSSRLASKMQRLKKIVAEKLLLGNKSVEKIFILNDDEGVDFLNKAHRCKQFVYLPDPIFSYSLPSPILSKQKFQFLIFGAINERKNITAILKAYDAANFSKHTEMIIVGPGEESYLQYVKDLIKNLKTIGTEKSVSLKPGFVSNEEMDNYFSCCDSSLLIYKDFFGSSGLLGRAALHNKKVIGTNVGLLKELIEKNNLGITCDPNSIEEISKALMAITDVHIETESFERFYNKYSPDTFIATLLNE